MEGETVIPGQGEPGVLEQGKTILAEPVVCPVCDTENPAGLEWCEECGFFLSSQPESLTAEPSFATLVNAATSAEYPLKEGENTVGRGACNVVLAADNSVSRTHAKVVVEAPNIYLEDLGSTNGTFLNGVKVEMGKRVQIGPGDQIRFAGTTLEIAAPGATMVEREKAERQPVGRLEIEGGEGEAGHFGIFTGENSIGRHPSNDVPLGFDGHISGRHARITASEEGIFLEDLGSTNGTELNDRRLSANTKEPLSDGDALKMGKTTLRVKLEPLDSGAIQPQQEGTETENEERKTG